MTQSPDETVPPPRRPGGAVGPSAAESEPRQDGAGGVDRTPNADLDPHPSASPIPRAGDRGRFVVLDVLRGVALCGIIWLNVPAITGFSYTAVPVLDLTPWIEPWFRGRFIGQFAALFGMSFALILATAERRASRPRLVLVRRFGFLLGLGVLHGLLQPGEVLTEYALFGLVLLLPLSYVRWRWVSLVLGVVALAAVGSTGAEPGYNDVGLMLMGFGAARLGLPARLERPGRGVLAAGAGLLVAYGVLVVLQSRVSNQILDGAAAAYTWADFWAGVVGAALYAVVVVLLLHTPLRPVLRAVFEPLGRLALTNYVGATLLAVLAQLVLRPPFASNAPDLLVCGAILLVQVVASRLWLTRHTYGPLEWVWRCVTWWQRVPLVRTPSTGWLPGKAPSTRRSPGDG